MTLDMVQWLNSIRASISASLWAFKKYIYFYCGKGHVVQSILFKLCLTVQFSVTKSINIGVQLSISSSPKFLIFLNWNYVPLTPHSPFPFTTPLPTVSTNALSDSMNLTLLGISHSGIKQCLSAPNCLSLGFPLMFKIQLPQLQTEDKEQGHQP